VKATSGLSLKRPGLAERTQFRRPKKAPQRLGGGCGGALLAEPAVEHPAGDTNRDRFRGRLLNIGEQRLTQTVQDLVDPGLRSIGGGSSTTALVTGVTGPLLTE
jgi:hypothetical protein